MKQHLHPQAVGFEGGSSQPRSTELILPDKDASGLAAYLQLFTCVFSNASVSDMESRVAELEASVQVHPLWDVFFQLMCHPVPQVRFHNSPFPNPSCSTFSGHNAR